MDFDALAQRFLGEPGVSEGQMFGMAVLKAGGKVFAGLWQGSELVVKLPRERVEALIAAGEGKAFAPMAGRTMKEWVIVSDDSLAGEALDFVRRSA